MISVGFNNQGFHPESEDMARYMNAGLEGFIQAAHDLGFTKYQVQTNPGLLSTAESFTALDISKIGKKIDELGIEMHLHHHGQNACPDVFLFAEKGELYNEFGEYVKNAVEFIHSVGGDIVTFHPPFSDTGDDPNEKPINSDTRQKAVQAFNDLVRELGDFAGERGVKLGIESAVWGPPERPWTSIFITPEEFDQFVKAPGFPDSVGILAEISHLHHMGYDLRELLTLWGEKVFEIHTSDAVVHQWTGKKHYSEQLVPETHRVVGTGTLDFRTVIQTLKKINFHGWMSLEIFPMHVKSLEDFITSRTILEKIIQEE